MQLGILMRYNARLHAGGTLNAMFGELAEPKGLLSPLEGTKQTFVRLTTKICFVVFFTKLLYLLSKEIRVRVNIRSYCACYTTQS